MATAADLPEELFATVLAYVCPDLYDCATAEEKRLLSACSLTCVWWAQQCRRHIFEMLTLRSANDARARLQQELGEMRVVLKKLREQSRNSFGCFKRSRSEKDRGRPERKPTGT